MKTRFDQTRFASFSRAHRGEPRLPTAGLANPGCAVWQFVSLLTLEKTKKPRSLNELPR
jgi:hypothetical protein